jgi:hypothetical protein
VPRDANSPAYGERKSGGDGNNGYDSHLHPPACDDSRGRCCGVRPYPSYPVPDGFTVHAAP